MGRNRRHVRSHNKMKIIISLFLLASYVSAQSFVIQGTNVVQIAYEDAELTASEKAFIGTDIMRTITPGVVFAEVKIYTNELNAGYINISTPRDDYNDLSLTRQILIQGTSVVWTINKSYTDCYKANMSFFNTHSNAIAKAFEFANMLITNPIPTMSANQVKRLYLMKSFPPDGMPDKMLSGFRRSFGEGSYFPPSLLGFSLRQHGPSGGTYLWGYLPGRTDVDMDSVPIIYYADRWWLSYWGMYEDEQVW